MLTPRESTVSSALATAQIRPNTPFLGRYWLVCGVGLAALADLLLLQWARLSIAVSAVSIGYVVAAALGIVICYRLRAASTPAQRIVRDLIEALLLFIAICLLGAVASYPLALESRGFVDHGLQRFDALIHFDWLSWYEMVARHSWIQLPERAAYLSIYVSPAILLGYFAVTNRRGETQSFIASYGVAAVITLCFFPFLPAAGPFATLWHGAAPYMPLSALYQDQVIGELRQHAVTSVDLGALHGLVCAPSFHAASAVLYMAAGWRIARLRWLIVALNVAMLLATPIEGTHYLIDIVMGMLVAISALILTPILIKAVEGRSAAQAERPAR